MRIDVLYFAVVRERLRKEREDLELPAGATVRDALTALADANPDLRPLLPALQVAVNRAMVPVATALSDGDEMALIPPVAGGSGPRRVAIESGPLSLDEVVQAVAGPERGGIVTFSGVVRRQGHLLSDVVRLVYEAYAEMALGVLTEIADEIEREWAGVRIAIHHRTGSLDVGEVAVSIAAAAPHRHEAFEACRAAIDRLKTRVPIWKKEIGPHGEEWLGLGS